MLKACESYNRNSKCTEAAVIETIWVERNITITSRVKSLGSFAEHPPDYIHCTRLRDKCVNRSRFLARSPLSAPPWEPVCPATPGRRSIATILSALLSPSIVAAQCVKLTVSLSARFHTVARENAECSTATHTDTQTHTHTLLSGWSTNTLRI